jgi:hypothetical protein
MSVLSPADRARRASMRLGLVIAVLAFLVVGGDVLLDQWITGYASAVFILGTAALIAGICIGLFAIIGALGLALAAALRDKAVMQPASKDPASRRTIDLGHAVNAVRENWFLGRDAGAQGQTWSSQVRQQDVQGRR